MQNDVKGKEAVMARVIDVATDLISEKSISSVTIREIAKTAGINHGLIHRHFGSKRNLLIHVVRHVDSIMREVTEGAESLREAIERAGEASRRDPRIWRVPARMAMDGEMDLLKELHGSFLKDLLDLAVKERGGERLDRKEVVEKFYLLICMTFGTEMFGDYIARSLEIDQPEDRVMNARIIDLFLSNS
jgi:TetR/AcrR family transcriptional regulator, repressor for neighboring sulfatase